MTGLPEGSQATSQEHAYGSHVPDTPHIIMEYDDRPSQSEIEEATSPGVRRAQHRSEPGLAWSHLLQPPHLAACHPDCSTGDLNSGKTAAPPQTAAAAHKPQSACVAVLTTA